jgi:hypothetical protein
MSLKHHHAKGRALLGAALLTCAAAHAQGLTFSGPAPNFFNGVAAYSVRVDALSGGYDEIYFSKTDTTQPYPGDTAFRQTALTYVTSTLAAYIDLYPVAAGDTFADSSLAMGARAQPSLLNGAIIERLDRTPNRPTTFYLGVRTYLDPMYAPGNTRNALGWLYIENTQLNGLRLLDSHIAYNASSIVIGQVPEASAWSLASLGALTVLGAALRRSRRH